MLFHHLSSNSHTIRTQIKNKRVYGLGENVHKPLYISGAEGGLEPPHSKERLILSQVRYN